MLEWLGGNKVAKEGRPLKFKSVKELQAKIDEYFKSCWKQKIDMFGNPVFLKDKSGKKTEEKVMVQFKPYTITGLAVFLDTTRETLLDYEAKDKFSDTIKRAKETCQAYAEESLFIGKNPTGPIFNLKNNYGRWKDKSEVDLTLPKPILGGDVSSNNGDQKASEAQQED
jgi:hypothetical protein